MSYHQLKPRTARASIELILFCFIYFACVTAAAPSPFSRLCKKRNITVESNWRECALRSIQEWNNGALEIVSSNLTTVLPKYAGYLDPNIVLRLEPVGTFVGLDMVAEYLTIFSSPTGPVTILMPLSYVIRRFTAQSPIAVATVDILFRNVFTGTTANFTVDQWFRFNDYNRIVLADFTLARYVEFMSAMQLDVVLAQSPNISSTIITGVCTASARFCSSPELERYTNLTSCVGFLSSIPFINPLRVAANTVMCRFLHASLVAFAPQIHCSHIGPSGGGACIDATYASYYSQPDFTPTTFVSQ